MKNIFIGKSIFLINNKKNKIRILFFYILLCYFLYKITYLTFENKPIYISLLFLLFIIIFTLNSYEHNLVKIIFWISFFLMFISNFFIQKYIFSIDSFKYNLKLYWLIDLLIFLAFFKLLFYSKYQKKILFFLFILIFYFLIHVLFNSQSLLRMILSFRNDYIFIILIFILYIYDFNEKFYHYFFNLFYKLAIINSILSLISFIIIGFNKTGDYNGGIFGLHGTGTGVLFAVGQALLFIHMYRRTSYRKYIVFAFISLMFIITGKAYAGILLFFTSFILIFIIKIKNLKNVFKLIATSLIILPLFGYLTFKFIPKYELEKTYLRFTNYYELEKYDNAFKSGFGRITSVQYALHEIKKSDLNLLIGYGFGSIAYAGATTGIKSKFLSKYSIKSLFLSLIYIYETGSLGMLFFIYFSIYFFIIWKKAYKIPKGKFIDNYENIPVLILLFLASIFYTAAFKNYFLIIYLGIHLSLLSKYYKIYNKLKYEININKK